MLLHNQKGHAFTWSADGVEYSFGPYGSCEVPDRWLPHMRAQGIPVDIAPIPPKVKVDAATEAERVALESSKIVQLQKSLADAEARADESLRSAEAAMSREGALKEQMAKRDADNATLTQQVDALTSDAAEYEKMLTEAAQKIKALEDEQATSKAKSKRG